MAAKKKKSLLNKYASNCKCKGIGVSVYINWNYLEWIDKADKIEQKI